MSTIYDKIVQAYRNILGLINGKADLVAGKVPAGQLPDDWNDVQDFDVKDNPAEGKTAFPEEGIAGVLYIERSTNKAYRWSITEKKYIEVGNAAQVQSDWNEQDPDQKSFIRNKPDAEIAAKRDKTDLTVYDSEGEEAFVQRVPSGAEGYFTIVDATGVTPVTYTLEWDSHRNMWMDDGTTISKSGDNYSIYVAGGFSGNVALTTSPQDVTLSGGSLGNKTVTVTGYVLDTLAKTSELPTIDSALSETSENAVQNKVVKAALDTKQGKLVAGADIAIAEDGKTIGVTPNTFVKLGATNDMGGSFDAAIRLVNRNYGGSDHYPIFRLYSQARTDRWFSDFFYDAIEFTAKQGVKTRLGFERGTQDSIVRKEEMDTALAGKQAKLVAGANITIAEDGKTISASVTVDDVLSSTSTNPVQNKVVKTAIDKKLDANAGTATGGLTVEGEFSNIFASAPRQISLSTSYASAMDEIWLNIKHGYHDFGQYGTYTLKFPVKSGTFAVTDDIPLEKWKDTIDSIDGVMDDMLGAKRLPSGNYPRLHARNKEIHGCTGFSNETDTHTGLELLLPWDVAMSNETSYLMAGVKFQANRGFGTQTYVQPLVPKETTAASAHFPYAIPAFEDSPVYWKGHFLYSNARQMHLPWDKIAAGGQGTLALTSELAAVKRELRYDLVEKVGGSVALDDRACNYINATTLSDLAITFPPFVADKVRDFIMVLECSADIPTISYESFITLEGEVGVDLTPEEGVNVYFFKEVVPWRFVVARKLINKLVENVPVTASQLLRAMTERGIDSTAGNFADVMTTLGITDTDTITNAVNAVMKG